MISFSTTANCYDYHLTINCPQGNVFIFPRQELDMQQIFVTSGLTLETGSARAGSRCISAQASVVRVQMCENCEQSDAASLIRT